MLCWSVRKNILEPLPEVSFVDKEGENPKEIGWELKVEQFAGNFEKWSGNRKMQSHLAAMGHLIEKTSRPYADQLRTLPQCLTLLVPECSLSGFPLTSPPRHPCTSEGCRRLWCSRVEDGSYPPGMESVIMSWSCLVLGLHQMNQSVPRRVLWWGGPVGRNRTMFLSTVVLICTD